MKEGIHVVLKAEHMGSVFGLPLTNSVLMAWMVMAILFIFAFLFRRSLSLVPGRAQAGVEWAVENGMEYMTSVFDSKALAQRFFPLIASLFLFILAINEIKFFPGVGSIGLLHDGHLVPFFHPSTADLNFTLALAIISVLVIEISGIVVLGFFAYAGRYVNLKSPVGFVVGLIELASNLGRLISFSFRLFGNIFAGKVLLAVVVFFLPYVVPVPVMLFEMFVGVVQAIVFAMLTLFFIKLSVMDPHEAH